MTHKTTEEKREDKLSATLRVHVEVPPGGGTFNSEATVFRQMPVTLTVSRNPILTEGDLKEARVVDTHGGYQISVQFDDHGKMILEQFTMLNPGKHFAIFAEWGDHMTEHRWLAAPVLRGRVSDGNLTFTPDATREEAEDIARGLMNIGKKVQKELEW
jgi:preprotein translocase subunit SecD